MRSRLVLAAAATTVVTLATLTTAQATAGALSSASTVSSTSRPSPISRAGSWLVDGSGRVLVLHGVDIVRKTAPWYPETFTAQDAQFLRSEGFNAARIGLAWTAVEPQPGVYDDTYISKFVQFEQLLAQYGIRTLIDFHQDLWSSQNMPAWATRGLTYADDFQAFWDNSPAPDGVGIQTHYINAWQHVARFLAGDTNVIGFDPFNEPQPGEKSGCAPYTQCPQFEATELASFYARYLQALRQVDTSHVVLVEPVADNNLTAPALPLLADAQTGTTFHEYCNITQTATSSGPQDALCQPIDQQGLDTETNYARKTLGVPTFVGEFSSGDADDDNAYMVDLMAARFLSWTIWSYYTAAQDPANTPGQGLLLDDTQPGSEANAKQAKLDAIAIPYASAIAGTPISTAFDRSSHTYQLTYSTAAVPGTTLTSNATTIFLPARVYPNGFHITADNATYTVDGREVTVKARPGATTVTVSATL